jgi:hypothetical protein
MVWGIAMILKRFDYGETAKRRSRPTYGAVGGVKYNHVKQNVANRALGAIAKRPSAAEFNGEMKGRTLVVAGNSYTLQKVRWRSLQHFKMLGCNGAFLAKRMPWPEYAMCGDRSIYWRIREEGGWYNGAKAGAKIMLATSIFDPTIMLRGSRGKRDDSPLKAQPMPRHQWYRYIAGAKVKNWDYHDVVEKGFVPPFEFDNLGRPLVPGHCIAVSMLQAALAMKAKKVLCIGLEITWPNRGQTHFYRRERRKKTLGPWSASVIRACLGHIKDEYARRKVKIHNLSPVKNSLFAEVFGHSSYKKALKD